MKSQWQVKAARLELGNEEASPKLRNKQTTVIDEGFKVTKAQYASLPKVLHPDNTVTLADPTELFRIVNEPEIRKKLVKVRRHEGRKADI
jgi:hypothetical protein